MELEDTVIKYVNKMFTLTDNYLGRKADVLVWSETCENFWRLLDDSHITCDKKISLVE